MGKGCFNCECSVLGFDGYYCENQFSGNEDSLQKGDDYCDYWRMELENIVKGVAKDSRKGLKYYNFSCILPDWIKQFDDALKKIQGKQK